MEESPKRAAEHGADPELGRLYERWDRSIRDFVGRIAIVSIIGAIGIQLTGNIGLIRATSFGSSPWGDWSLCAGVSVSDAIALVTQCLAIIAVITIALVAAPRVSRPYPSLSAPAQERRPPLSFEQLAIAKWVRGLRYLAGIIAGVSNAVTATMIIGLGRATPRCGDPLGSGTVFSLVLLSGISTLMAGLALRPAEDFSDLADDVRAAELSVTRLRIDRIRSKLQDAQSGPWASVFWHLACFVGALLISCTLSILIVVFITHEVGAELVSLQSILPVVGQVTFLHSLVYFVMLMINLPLLALYWICIGRNMLRVAKWATVLCVVFDTTVVGWLLVGMQASLPGSSVWIGAALLIPAAIATLMIVLPLRRLRWNLNSSTGWSFIEALASIFHWAGLGRCDGLRIAVLV